MKNKNKNKSNNSLIITIAVVVLALFALGTYLYTNSQKSDLTPEQEKSLIRDYSLISGDKDAKVTVVEFMDPSCGTCIYFSPVVEELGKKYDGKVKVVYRFLPYYNGSDFILSLVHAANDQGRFEEALKLFLTQHNRWYTNHQVNPFIAWGILTESGVDITKAQEYINENGDLIKGWFEQNSADATALGVTGTPTFFVNGKKLEKLSREELIALIESEIAKVY